MSIHRIRLRGPWDVRPADGSAAGQMTVPGTLLDGGWPGFSGRVSFYRRFGRPSNLSADETVWLVFTNVIGPSRLLLNDVSVGDVNDTAEFDVTDRLAGRNSLELIVDAANDRCGIVGEVLIEIRRAAIPG